MPLTQLMRKLRKPGSPTNLQAQNMQQGMDAEGPCYMVTAEVMPASEGRRSPCSTLSRTSSAASDTSTASAPQQPQSSHAFMAAAPTAVGPRPACPVARAQRARDKAAQRSQSLVTEPHPALMSMGSMAVTEEQTSVPLQRLACTRSIDSNCDAIMQPGSYGAAYHRASTAPLPWSSQQRRVVAPSDDTGEDDEQLVSPSAVHHEEDESRCDWEDGVVASWLQGIDHTDLAVCDGEDDEFHHQLKQQPHPQQCVKVPAGGLTASQRTTSSMSGVSAVFGSLLYN